MFQKQQSTIVCNMAADMQSEFLDIQQGLQMLGRNADLMAPDTDRSKTMAPFIESHADVLGRVLVADLSGNTIWRTLPGSELSAPTRPEQSESQRPEVSPDTDQVRFSFRPETNVLEIIAPVRSAQKTRGTLRCEVDLRTFFFRYQAGVADRPKGPCWMVGQGGAIIASSGMSMASSENRQAGRTLQDHDSIAELLERECMGLGLNGDVQLDIDGDAMFTAFSPFVLGDRRYGLAIAGDLSAISVPMRAHERLIYSLLGALSLLYIAVVYVVYRGDSGRIKNEKEQRSMAESANKAKSEFLAKMSHEFALR